MDQANRCYTSETLGILPGVFFFLVLVFQDRLSDCPGTCSVDQDCLELRTQRTTCLCLLSAGMIAMYHYA